MNTYPNFGLCICTYKRPQLLKLLLEDCTKQSIAPVHIFIIDGDNSSNEVIEMLKSTRWPENWNISYLMSNHGNQTYQRYLGFRMAAKRKIKMLLYLDDDLRIENNDSFEAMIFPLYSNEFNAAAVTGNLIFQETQKEKNSITLDDFRRGINPKSFLVRIFGETRRYLPGELTPSGKRVVFLNDEKPYHKVEWLCGGAIAFNMDFLSEKILSDDIFAMNHHKMGLCEDLVIARKLLDYGNLFVASKGIFLHPSDDAPKAYSSKSFTFGYASAYSRRWLNDNYRGSLPPTLSDRFSLFRHYLVSFGLNWFRALKSFKGERINFALGYSKGVIWSLLKTPTAKNLTPEIDWWQDAEEALRGEVRITP